MIRGPERPRSTYPRGARTERKHPRTTKELSFKSFCFTVPRGDRDRKPPHLVSHPGTSRGPREHALPSPEGLKSQDEGVCLGSPTSAPEHDQAESHLQQRACVPRTRAQYRRQCAQARTSAARTAHVRTRLPGSPRTATRQNAPRAGAEARRAGPHAAWDPPKRWEGRWAGPQHREAPGRVRAQAAGPQATCVTQPHPRSGEEGKPRLDPSTQVDAETQGCGQLGAASPSW